MATKESYSLTQLGGDKPLVSFVQNGEQKVGIKNTHGEIIALPPFDFFYAPYHERNERSRKGGILGNEQTLVNIVQGMQQATINILINFPNFDLPQISDAHDAFVLRGKLAIINDELGYKPEHGLSLEKPTRQRQIQPKNEYALTYVDGERPKRIPDPLSLPGDLFLYNTKETENGQRDVRSYESGVIGNKTVGFWPLEGKELKVLEEFARSRIITSDRMTELIPSPKQKIYVLSGIEELINDINEWNPAGRYSLITSTSHTETRGRPAIKEYILQYKKAL